MTGKRPANADPNDPRFEDAGDVPAHAATTEPPQPASRSPESEALTLDPPAAGNRDAATGGLPERPGAFGPGAVLNGRYRISKLLGQGGMGAVYQVDDQLYPGRPTALKMFLHRPAHPVDLFRVEFKTMASLRHPNVARVYDFETVAGLSAFFFTMELISGTTLLTSLKDDARRALAAQDASGTHTAARSPSLPWQDVVELLSGGAKEAVPTWLQKIVERLCAIEPATRQPTAL